MASRRHLKRDINYVIGDIFTECIIYKEFVPGTDKAKADDIMVRLLQVDNEFITRISHTEPGNAKEYYRQLVKEFNEAIALIIDSLSKVKE